MKKDRELGVTLVVSRAELARMMKARAKAHLRRVAIHADRMKKLGELLHKTGTVEMDKVAGTVAIAIEDQEFSLSNARGMRYADLSNSSMNDLQNHVLYARDRQRAHRQAAVWLEFAAKHLKRPQYEFLTRDEFLAYLVDLDHPMAMPNERLMARGVQ